MAPEVDASWKQIIRTIIQRVELDAAVDTICALIEPRQTERPAVAPPPQNSGNRPPPKRSPGRPPSANRNKSSSSASPNGQASQADVEQLSPYESYTVEQAVNFTGYSRQTIYNILRDRADELPHTREGERIMIKGRGLNMLKYKRLKQGMPAESTVEEPSDLDPNADTRRRVVEFHSNDTRRD